MKKFEGIREFRIKDMRKFVEMLGKEWNLGKRQSCTKGNVCAWLYAFWILADAKHMYTYEKNNKAVGFCGFGAYQHPLNIRQRMYLMLFNLYRLHPLIIYPKKLDDYYERYEYVPEQLKTPGNGSLSVILVDPKYRGKGIGRKLFEFVISQAEKSGVKKIIIETDESCNVNFYEKLGCKKIKDVGLFDEQGSGQVTEHAFLYEKAI